MSDLFDRQKILSQHEMTSFKSRKRRVPVDDPMEEYKQKTTLNSPKFVEEFIQIYKSLPALWKLRSREYAHRFEKTEAYTKLIQKLREVDPLANREAVVRKINNLRTSYRRELKKVQNSRLSAPTPNDVYKPLLWYYHLMSFLEEQESVKLRNKPSADDSDDNEDSTPLFDMPPETAPVPSLPQPVSHIKLEPLDISDPVLNFDNLSESAESTDYHPLTGQQELRTDTMRILTTPVSTPNILNCSICSTRFECSCWSKEKKDQSTECNITPQNSSRQPDDEFDAIGKTYAYKLRNLKHDQRIFAEKLISDVLFEAQLNGLNRDSIVFVKPENNLLN